MTKKITFSPHCLLKLKILEVHGLSFSLEFIEPALATPDLVEKGHKGRNVAQKGFNRELVLRIVYEENAENFFVITVYPGKKSRYEKNPL
jgi:hypothetical protein